MNRLLERDGFRLLLLVALFVGLRCVSITSDPPARLVSYYQDFAFSVFDEGWWTANARQWALTGDLRGTGFDLFWVSPTFSLVMGAAFGALGASLTVARSVSIALGAVGIVALWWIGRGAATRDRNAAHLAALFWAVAFAPAQLGRLATPESTGLAFGLVGTAVLLRGRRSGLIVAGACATLATLTKPHFGMLMPAFLLSAVVLAIRHERKFLPAASWTVLGFAIPALAWLGYVARHVDEATSLFGFYLKDRWFAGAPPDLSGGLAVIKPAAQIFLAGVVYRHLFFLALPGVFLLAALALPRVGSALVIPRRARSISDAALVFAIWAIVGGALISTIPFQPLRYYLPFAPALVFLAAWTLTVPASDVDSSNGVREGTRRALRVGVSFFVLTQIAFALVSAALPTALMPRTSTHVALFHPEEFHLTSFLISLAKTRSLAPFARVPFELAYVASLALSAVIAVAAGGLATVLLVRTWARGLAPLHAVSRHARLIVTILLALHILHWVWWFPHRATTLPDMGRSIARLVPPDALVSPGGSYSFQSALRFDSSAVLGGAMFDASGCADYFVALMGHPLIGRMPEGEIERRWPGSVREASFMLTGGYRYDLFRAPARAPNP